MKYFVLLILVGVAAAAPPPTGYNTQDDDVFLSEAWVSDQYKKYTSEHEIVNIFAPVKWFNTGSEKRVPIIFFVQGDYKEDETVDYKGLFALNIETGKATKILDNGIDFSSQYDNNEVFFAATDGIYTYNAETNTAEKYGSLTDNFISIAKAKAEDVIYVLTADKEIYKITENGNKKEKVDDVKNAQQIALDDKDNIYFYDSKKHIYVANENGVQKIQGLPLTAKKITLLRTILVRPAQHAILGLIDDEIFQIYENGQGIGGDLKVHLQPTAIFLGSPLGVYFGYNKSVYEHPRPAQ